MTVDESKGAPAPEREYLDDDEINLLDLVIPLLKRKWMIACIVFFAGVAAVIYSLSATEMYRSEAVIVPVEQERASLSGQLAGLGGLGGMVAQQIGIGGAGSLEKFQVVLKSRDLTNSLIEQHALLPVVFQDDWDADKRQWMSEEPPTNQDAYRALQDMLEINADTRNNVLTLRFVHSDPVLAAEMLGYYVEGLSEFMRRQSMENVAAQRATLEKQLAATADPMLRNKLADIVAQYVEREVLASVQRYFGFNVVDPPFVPEQRFSPKRAQICVLSVLVAFFVAVFAAFALEFAGNLKNREPERLAEMKRYMRLRRR